MAIDLTSLTQTELLHLVNATSLGAVLTRSRLRHQMDVAALRFGDGTRIHFVKYVRWLVIENALPRPAKMDYVETRRRQAARNRAATKAGQDIAPIPEVEDYERRKRCGESFRLFCETYFPKAFYRAWSEDHLRVSTHAQVRYALDYRTTKLGKRGSVTSTSGQPFSSALPPCSSR